jgi:glycosyltransferase involved in cell wall biosynthesis
MGSESSRPFAFLISTNRCVHERAASLGSPAYSYAFVVEALIPVLEEFGRCVLVDRPESRLPFLAARAVEDGFRPVHLCVNPPQDGYMTPALPTILYPFWEFPRIPDRDFGFDTRQNWARLVRPASLILTACHFTAKAFEGVGLRCPIAVVPTPLDPAHFTLPPWDPKASWTLKCRHTSLGEEPAPLQASTGLPSDDAPSWPESGLWRIGKRGFHKIYPWLDPRTVERVSRVKDALRFVLGHSPAKLAFLGIRGTYRRTVRRWLSLAALQKVTNAKNRVLAWFGRTPTVVVDPLLPSDSLTLGGLVYTSIFNLGDLRKNYIDMISAFLIAFRDRSDVTLVLKLATSPHREHHEVGVLRVAYEALGLAHRCRVAVITEYLDDEAMRGLMQATTYYVNTSHSEGACLPLQQALAGGRPGIAPDHTAMADYMDDQVGFVIRSHTEPTFWPHDPEKRLETERHRVLWSDIHDHFLESAAVADLGPARYEELSRNARRRMTEYASRPVTAEALRHALTLLPDSEPGALAWAS